MVSFVVIVATAFNPPIAKTLALNQDQSLDCRPAHRPTAHLVQYTDHRTARVRSANLIDRQQPSGFSAPEKLLS